MRFMDSCVFCAIIHGKGEASVVCENSTYVAFMDIRPVNTGHVLIVPKVHAACLNDLDENVAAQLFKAAMLSNRVIEGLRG